MSHPFIKDSAFKQQRLPAWQPVLTAGTVLPTFFVIGIAFIPVGIALLYFSDEVSEHVIDYTNCLKLGGVNNETCADFIQNNTIETCTCNIDFMLDKDFVGKVYMYYGLSNYYQNHRRYVKSRDDDQLLGRLSGAPSSDCEPFAYNGSDKPIAPCGAIANSLFSDTFKIKSQQFGDVVLLGTEIAWPSDRNIKFRNPPGSETKDGLRKALEGFARPKAWRKDLWELDEGNNDNNGFQVIGINTMFVAQCPKIITKNVLNSSPNSE